MAEEKNSKIERKRTAKETASFLFKSIYKNEPAMQENERGWLAVLIFFISVILTVTGILISGLNANANAIISTSTDTAIDVGLRDFAVDIDDSTNNRLYIEDGKAEGYGKFAFRTYANNVMEPNSFYTYGTDNAVVLRTWCLDLDPVGKSADSTTLTAFLNKSVYLYETTYDATSSSSSSAATWTPSSFIIFTRTSVHVATYKISGAASTDSAISSIYGTYGNNNFNFYTLGHSSTGTALTKSEVSSNFLAFMNQAYSSVKISATWLQVGVYSGIDAGVIILCGFVFFLISRSKSSIIHYSCWRAMKICAFYSFTPAIVAFAFSFFMSTYTPFIFLMVMALRVMSASQRLSGASTAADDKPVYKARS